MSSYRQPQMVIYSGMLLVIFAGWYALYHLCRDWRGMIRVASQTALVRVGLAARFRLHQCAAV